MKPCWPDGDLRAYLDGELPCETRQQIGEHLALCAACSARYGELSERAAWVGSFIAMLPEAASVGAVRRAPVRHRRQWAIAAVALAAALAIGFVILTWRSGLVGSAAQAPATAASTQAEQPAVARHPVAVTSMAQAPAAAAPVPLEPPAAAPHPARRRGTQPAQAALADYFLRLDDEPIETGTLVRVGVEGGDVQADLILGPDGRARAIRIVSNQ